MTKIAIAARYADDSPYGRAQVTIRLVDGGAGAALPGGLSVDRTFVECDVETGEAIVDLTPNEDITDPPGTYYALTVERTSPTVVRYIEVPQPNGSGDAEIPYSWDDETIQRLNPTPPRSFPAATTGDAGDVMTVVDDGNGKKWEAQPPTGGSGGPVNDEDVAVEEGTAPLLHSASAVSTWEGAAAAQGVSGDKTDDIAGSLPYVITAAGSNQEEINDNAWRLAALTLGQAALARDEAAAVAADLVTLYETADVATLATFRAAEDAVAAARADAFRGAVLNLCSEDGGTHESNSWTTPKPGSFTTGFWTRFDAIVAPLDDGISHLDGDEVYSEIATQMTEGDGGGDDNFEAAFRRKLIDGVWQVVPYFEASPTGSPTDSYKLNAGVLMDTVWPVVEGVLTTHAIWVQFDVSGQSRGRIFRQVFTAPGDIVLQGDQWVTLCDHYEDPTSIDAGVIDPWGFGYDSGRILVPSVEIRDVGPDGAVLADVRAADAIAVDPAGLTAFEDQVGNIVTPGPDAVATAPASSGVSQAYVDAKIEDAIANGETAKAPSQNAVFDALALKAPLANPTFTGTVAGVTATHVGLGSVTNDAQIAKSLVTTKGDLIVATGSATPARLAVGADGKVPLANANETSGVGWYAPGSTHSFASGVFTPNAAFVSATMAMTANRLYACKPFLIRKRRTFDRIGLMHVSGVSTTGVIRIDLAGITEVDGLVGAQLFGEYSLDITATGAAVSSSVIKTSGTISLTLDPGLYYPRVVAQWSGGTGPTVNARANDYPPIYPDAFTQGAGNTMPIQASVSGAIPTSSWTPTAAVNTSPVVYLQPT